jgi:hypothetical protein
VRKVFSSNVLSETVLVRDALEHHGIAVTIQNENSSYSAIPEFRPPAELWVTPDSDYDRARQVVIDTLATLDSTAAGRPWVCANCREENPRSFEICWNCGRAAG